MKLTCGRAYLPLYTNTDKFILLESPRGCLKTISALDCLMSRAARWAGKRWYLWRSTRALLSTTVLPSFEEYVLPRWQHVAGMRLTNPDARPTQRSEYVFENGSVFLPIGMDDVLRGTSAEGAGGYLAEAIELASADQATALVGMMRQPGVPFHQILVDVNPGAPGHWANKIAEPVPDTLRRVRTPADYLRVQEHNMRPTQGGWKRIISRIQDNPHFFDLAAWKLTAAGESYIEGLQHLSGHMKRRWLDGEWVAAEGGVFPEFTTSTHVVPPFEVPADWPWFVGWDPGFDHPTAIVFMARGPAGDLFVGDEIYAGGFSVAEHVHGVAAKGHVGVMDKLKGKTVHRWFGDPHEFFSSRAQGRSVALQAKDAGLGVNFSHWANQSKQAMVEEYRELLQNSINGKHPGIYFMRHCVNTIAEHQSWRYKRMTDGTLPAGDDCYEDKSNHSLDVLVGMTGVSDVRAKQRGTIAGRADSSSVRSVRDATPATYYDLVRLATSR